MKSMKKWLFFLIIFSVAATSVFARGNTEIPQTQFETSGAQYISPNADGVQEEATIRFEVTVYVKSDEGYVPEYGITLSAPDGTIIRQVVVTEESDLGWFLRIFRSFQAFTLAKTIEWDGRDENGDPVADGEYAAAMWVVAGSDQRQDIELDSFFVDTNAPEVTVSNPSPSIFSPNGDGNIDELDISQENGSSEDLWLGTFTDASGTAVKTYRWTNEAPEDISWDGTDDGGALAKDGIFGYSLTSTDRAGNSFSYSFDTIELNTVDTPLTVSLANQFLSPNGDGAQDTVLISLAQNVEEDIVEWRVVVDDGAGTVVRTFGGSSNPPKDIVFDGMNDAGQPIAEGDYRVLYTLLYENGNNPGAAQTFLVDVSDPVISIAYDSEFISPNGDGRKDEIEVSFKSNEIVTWTGTFSDSSGKTVMSTNSGQTTSLVVWRGTDLSGNMLGEGVYTAVASFTDRAGNVYTTPKGSFVIDLTAPQVTFDVDKTYFSPDGDGIKDTVTARFTSNEPVRGLLSISDTAGRDMGTLGGYGRAVQPIEGSFDYTWGGISGSGLYIPDGAYVVSSTYEDRAGNRLELPDVDLVVDTRQAAVRISAPKGFSPNGDSVQDTLAVDVDAAFYDTVESWQISYVDAAGKVVQQEEGSGSLPSKLIWNGGMQFASDIMASEGRYTAKLNVVYQKGDSIDASSQTIFVDVTPPAVALQATADPFAKTSESSMEGDIYVTLQIEDAHDVSDWTLDVVSPGNEIVRSFAGTGDLEDQVVWKKEGERVTRVPIADMVTLRVLVTDEVGNQTIFEQPVPLDLLVVRRDGKLYLLVPNVIFGAYQHALDSRGSEMLASNLASIGRVKAIFDKYTNYDLALEGHALNIYRGDAKKEADEEEVLVPLTERRAATVEQALVDLGMDDRRIETAAFGGTQPIVDVLDKEVRWKNRRVEFIMVEK
ncbi:MAG: hypothetical protein HN368_13535 [Spirochaetales bacterium]|jgi:flagellar hook assembly protein FlgD|nr:hypothetical protein [Spirochaetales bacterium]